MASVARRTTRWPAVLLDDRRLDRGDLADGDAAVLDGGAGLEAADAALEVGGQRCSALAGLAGEEVLAGGASEG